MYGLKGFAFVEDIVDCVHKEPKGEFVKVVKRGCTSKEEVDLAGGMGQKREIIGFLFDLFQAFISGFHFFCDFGRLLFESLESFDEGLVVQ